MALQLLVEEMRQGKSQRNIGFWLPDTAVSEGDEFMGHMHWPLMLGRTAVHAGKEVPPWGLETKSSPHRSSSLQGGWAHLIKEGDNG
ncbi:hypothetical protein NDU88_003811 [Pleurodeles waltl]|uniref:Uncharacterized protein n=1 Tax=Pleurodeles waltl TaxID=8319 RepID=A0AAV7PDW7_PLEWA|nr:hypothetical protein NDU88_003811 [Pleurodeles waltl]